MRAISHGTPNSIIPIHRLCHSASSRRYQEANAESLEATSPVSGSSERPPLPHPHSAPPPSTVWYPELPKASRNNKDMVPHDASRELRWTPHSAGGATSTDETPNFHYNPISSLVAEPSPNCGTPCPSPRQLSSLPGGNRRTLRPPSMNRLSNRRPEVDTDASDLSMPETDLGMDCRRTKDSRNAKGTRVCNLPEEILRLVTPSKPNLFHNLTRA